MRPLMPTRDQVAVLVEDFGVAARIYPHGDALIMHNHVERRVLRVRLGHDGELFARLHPVISSPRLNPQADHAAGLVVTLVLATLVP